MQNVVQPPWLYGKCSPQSGQHKQSVTDLGWEPKGSASMGERGCVGEKKHSPEARKHSDIVYLYIRMESPIWKCANNWKYYFKYMSNPPLLNVKHNMFIHWQYYTKTLGFFFFTFKNRFGKKYWGHLSLDFKVWTFITCFIVCATLVELKCSLIIKFLFLKRLDKNISAFTKKQEKNEWGIIYIRIGKVNTKETNKK